MSICSDSFSSIKSYIEHIYDFKKVGFFRPRYYVYYTQSNLATEAFTPDVFIYKIRKKDYLTNAEKVFKIYHKIGLHRVTEMK